MVMFTIPAGVKFVVLTVDDKDVPPFVMEN